MLNPTGDSLKSKKPDKKPSKIEKNKPFIDDGPHCAENLVGACNFPGKWHQTWTQGFLTNFPTTAKRNHLNRGVSTLVSLVFSLTQLLLPSWTFPGAVCCFIQICSHIQTIVPSCLCVVSHF